MFPFSVGKSKLGGHSLCGVSCVLRVLSARHIHKVLQILEIFWCNSHILFYRKVRRRQGLILHPHLWVHKLSAFLRHTLLISIAYRPTWYLRLWNIVHLGSWLGCCLLTYLFLTIAFFSCLSPGFELGSTRSFSCVSGYNTGYLLTAFFWVSFLSEGCC